MMELVLPASLAPEEIACAEEVAKDLELQTELVSNLLVYQARPSLTFLERERWSGLID